MNADSKGIHALITDFNAKILHIIIILNSYLNTKRI